MEKKRIRFIQSTQEGDNKEYTFIHQILEVTPKKTVRNSFDASTNFALEDSIEYLALNPNNLVTIELVRK